SMSCRLLISVVVCLAVAAFPGSAAAVAFGIDTVLSGTGPGGGSAPWLGATFGDLGGGIVGLDLRAPGLSGDERATNWRFNLAPGLRANKLTFRLVDGTGAKKIKASKRTSDGYEIDLRFAKKGKKAFGEDDFALYRIGCRGCSGFDASAFDVLGLQNGGWYPTLVSMRGAKRSRSLLAASDLWLSPDPGPGAGGEGEGEGEGEGDPLPPTQPDGGPAPVASPEPSTLLLLGSGLLAIAARHRSRRPRA
ncbi:MAG: PEP-CTERM sorting domain-containing protein, partial [Candidatus Binatia bacterium]